MEEQKLLSQLKKTLLQAVRNCLEPDQKTALIFSGGIDSSLVAWTAYQLTKELTTFTIGFPQAADLEFVSLIKKKLPFPSLTKKLSPQDLEKALPPTLEILKKARIDPNLMQVSLAVCLYLVLLEIKKRGITLVLSGQGADELFAGYAKFKKVPLAKVNQVCLEEFDRAKKIDLCRDQAIATHFGLNLKNPYFDPAVVRIALKLPPGLKLKRTSSGIVNKYILRKLAEKIGLPEEIFNRPKKSFQYSTRIQREIEKMGYWKRGNYNY
ncbi:asparagine synthase C-terminal domain-containing protein [Patescibacteria group bacterium]